MKQTQEFEGKNVDNAVENACSALNISKKHLVYDIISSGSTGIFGIVGVRKAKIRVTLPEKKDKTKKDLESYDSDRAGVMSIVDEAFGKDVKPLGDKTYHDSSSENNLKSDIAESGFDQDKETNFIETSTDIGIGGDLELKKNLGNKKRGSGDKSAHSIKSKKSKSGKKGGTIEKPLIVQEEPAHVNGGILSETTIVKPIEEQIDNRQKDRISVSKQSLSNSKQQGGTKSYSRNSRSRKKDTWLKDDGDSFLNEAIDSMESDESILIPKLDKKSSHHKSKKRAFAKSDDSNKFRNSIDNTRYDDDSLVDDNQYSDEIDNEFLNEDFHDSNLEHLSSEENDAPYIKDDDEVVEIYDERDDGYPPKYKGETPVDVSEEAMRIGRETLQKMVALITDDAAVTAQSDEDRLLLRVEGGNSGVLIGRRGQTLEAMQYLTDKIINKFSESRVRLKVDIEGYMETRKANLKTLAYKMADKAKKTGKPATINQMTAQDRRVIHIALKDDPRVRTQSMGDGYYRRLVIFPKKSSFNNKRRRPFRK